MSDQRVAANKSISYSRPGQAFFIENILLKDNPGN